MPEFADYEFSPKIESVSDSAIQVTVLGNRNLS